MKFFRYRKPSIKTVLGITAAMRPFRAWGNLKRTMSRRVGYESEIGRLFRLGLRSPGGCALPALFAMAVVLVRVL